MTRTPPIRTALLLPVPGAEPAISSHRKALDLAAADGIPAHVTITYPFRALDEIDDEVHARLGRLGAATAPIEVEGRRTAWFGDSVLYVELTRTEAVLDLISRTAEAFPGCPPYGGDIPLDEIVPHITVGHSHPVPELREAAEAVDAALSIRDVIDQLELWAGPAPEGRTTPAPWRRVRSYRLGG